MDLNPDTLFHFLKSLPDGLIYVALGMCAFIENLFPPIPGDTITALGAFLVGVGRLNFLGVFGATTAGSLAGFLTLFAIGRALGRRHFLERDYRFFRAQTILRAEDWFRRYGYLLVALNRFLPGIRSAVSIAGGISRLKTAPVAALSLLSCAVWNGLWIFMGYSLGTQWELVQTELTTIMARYNTTVAVLGGLALVVALVIRALRRKRR
jgi:membrane protein DedA with SNARE-associated domain